MKISSTLTNDSKITNTEKSLNAQLLKNLFIFLISIDLILGIAHLLLPEYSWGQGRKSYFNLGNRLTLASWFISIQLFGCAILSIVSYQKVSKKSNSSAARFIWIVGSFLLTMLSFSELTRFIDRFNLLGFSDPDVYDQIIITFFEVFFLVSFGWFILNSLRKRPSSKKYVHYWLIMWGTVALISLFNGLNAFPAEIDTETITYISRIFYLLGSTLLFFSIASYVFLPEEIPENSFSVLDSCSPNPFPLGITPAWRYIGIGGMTFTMIFIQILLFRILSIYTDHLTTYSIISIALVGISIGGLIGWRTAMNFPMHSIIFGSLFLPLTVILSLAVIVKFSSATIIVALILMFPFIAASVVITILLVRTKSHIVYAVDLIGAAVGAMIISPALNNLREEGSILILSALTLIFAGCFVYYLPLSNLKNSLYTIIGFGAIILITLGVFNQDLNWLNIVQEKLKHKYPNAEFLFSKSSFTGRYDVVLTRPNAKTYKAFENGRTIDNIRSNPVENYKIDPRIPYTYMKNPKILIIGLSGDGVTKTARAVSNNVTGIEINPAIVSLQQNELVKYNNNSYKDIDVYVMDGKSFIAQSKEKFDMITLMNAHSVRGSTRGSAAGLEYLHTLEAMEEYFDHLTDNGILNIEEPANKPEREPAIWKLVLTMKQALINKGVTDPADHFFIFQWKTLRNNYFQILMKKTPFTKQDISNLKTWLDKVDRIKELEAIAGKRLGPIRAITTILYAPQDNYKTNYARILNGQIDKNFIDSKNLNVSTDDRPYLFSLDPNYGAVKTTYINTLVISVSVIPFLLSFLFRQRTKFKNSLPFVLIVMLTGMGYLLIEVVLIQRYQLFLGSPIESFTTVLGSLLIFSGLGSLWSGKVSEKRLYISIVIVLILLAAHQWIIPPIFKDSISYPLVLKIILTIFSIAPLAFFMGVIFPYILKQSKSTINKTAVGILFAINAAASAIAVPLAISLSTSYGMKFTFGIGMIIYLTILALLLSLKNKTIQKNMTGLVVIFFIGLLVFPLTTGSTFNEDVSGKYKIFGISQGESEMEEDIIFAGGSRNKKASFEWVFWLAKGNGKTILIDTGFDDEESASKWKIKNYQKPQKKLEDLRINPSEITDVILTHAHWDHIGSLFSYTNANVWMQQSEYDFMRQIFNESRKNTKGFRLKDFKLLQQIEKEGRLKLINGESQIFDGVTLTLGGMHTIGSQYVTLETIDGNVVIAGDNAYMYENIQKHKPVGSTIDIEANLSTLRDMHKQAASPFFILPGHDPKVFRWFPEIRDKIIEIKSVGK